MPGNWRPAGMRRVPLASCKNCMKIQHPANTGTAMKRLPPKQRNPDAIRRPSKPPASADARRIAEPWIRSKRRRGAPAHVEAGRVEIFKGSARASAEGGGGIPLIGRVAAGCPSSRGAHPGATRSIALFRPRADYLLNVAALPMRDAGILDGVCSPRTNYRRPSARPWFARLPTRDGEAVAPPGRRGCCRKTGVQSIVIDTAEEFAMKA